MKLEQIMHRMQLESGEEGEKKLPCRMKQFKYAKQGKNEAITWLRLLLPNTE